MKPRIDIDIRDYEGKTAELRDPSTFEPFEVYLNDERLVTSERVEELEDENARLRELVEDMLDCIEIREAFGRPPTSEICEEFSRRADELRIEADE